MYSFHAGCYVLTGSWDASSAANSVFLWGQKLPCNVCERAVGLVVMCPLTDLMLQSGALDVMWATMFCGLWECGASTLEPSDSRAGWVPVRKANPYQNIVNSVKRIHTLSRVEGVPYSHFPTKGLGWLVSLREGAILAPHVGLFCRVSFSSVSSQISLGKREAILLGPCMTSIPTPCLLCMWRDGQYNKNIDILKFP